MRCEDKSSGKTAQVVIREIFKELKRLKYVYLRDTAHLKKISSLRNEDIDILIQYKDIRRICQIMLSYGFFLTSRVRKHSRHMGFKHYRENLPVFGVQIDSLVKLPYIPGKDLIRCREEESGIYVFDKKHQLLILILKDLFLPGFIGKKYLSNSKKIQIAKLYKDNKLKTHVDKTLYDWFGNKAQLLISNLERNTPEKIITHKTELQIALFKKHPTWLRHSISNLFHYSLYQKLPTKKLLISFIGADGSGKSTATKITGKLLNDLQERCVELYLGRWIRVKSVNAAARASKNIWKNNSWFQTSLTPLLRDILYILKYTKESAIIAVLRITGRHVVTDRYVYDVEVQQNVTRIIRPLIRHLFTKPYPLIYLHNDAKAIFDRKGEFSVDEIARQQRVYDKIAIMHDAFKIESSNLEETTFIIACIISKIRNSYAYNQ